MSKTAVQIAAFRSQFYQRRFDDATLGILDSILMPGDVKSLIELQTLLKDFMRLESVAAIREISGKPIGHKLSVIEFLVRAFAAVNDVESCLALRYEALLARESISSTHQHWRVTFGEWLKFAQDSSESGFYSVAGKACERASMSHQNDHHKQDCNLNNMEAIEKIERLRLVLMSSSSRHPVQGQTSDYLKQKCTVSVEQSSLKRLTCHSASTSFREGIKKRNMCNLKHRQSIKKVDR